MAYYLLLKEFDAKSLSLAQDDRLFSCAGPTKTRPLGKAMKSRLSGKSLWRTEWSVSRR
jgi:hypothetical protein